MDFIKLWKRQRIFSMDKKRCILAGIFLVLAVVLFVFHFRNPVIRNVATTPFEPKEAAGPIFQDTELKQRFTLPKKNGKLQSIQIMFATYNDTIITKGLHFSLYDAVNDDLLYEEDILSERLSDNQYINFSLETLDTSVNKFYYRLRGLDANDGEAIPATVWFTDSDKISTSLEVNGEKRDGAINTIYTYRYEDITGYVILLLEVLVLMVALFVKIPERKKTSFHVIASVISFIINALLIVILGFRLGGVGTGVAFSVWIATGFMIIMMTAIIYAICGRVACSLIITDVLYFVFVFADYIVMKYRGVPIMPTDLFLLGTANTVIGHYEMSLLPTQAELLLGICFIIILLVRMEMSACFVVLNHRIKHRKKLFASFIFGVAGIFGIVLFASPKVLEFFHVDGSALWQPSTGYYANGPLMNFMVNIQFSYRKKPSGYTAEKAESILGQYSEEMNEDENETPNIIMIMNESLADFSILSAEITPDPLEFIHSLQENTVKGNLYVSYVGAGTANTEFMALTGHTMAFMPSGSMVYSILPRANIIGMTSELKKKGYSCIAMHPFSATNYNRYIIYPNMGFDDFLAETHFVGAETLRGWVSDKATYDKIIKIYEEKGEEPLFVFDVTMQGHGGYTPLNAWDIPVTAAGGNEEMTEYLSSIYVSDKAFQELIAYFAEIDEPTVIIMFGDHWPSVGVGYYQNVLGKSSDEMNFEEMQTEYITPYVLWANYDIEEKEMDISPNRISGLVKRTAGIPLSRYELFIEEFSKEIPVINVNGYQDKTGAWHTFDEENEYSDLILQYQYLQWYYY